jgi:hypothetical protein
MQNGQVVAQAPASGATQLAHAPPDSVAVSSRAVVAAQ